MVAIGGDLLDSIPRFFNHSPVGSIDAFKKMLQSALVSVYSCVEINRWMVDNLGYLCEEMSSLLKHLEESRPPNCYKILSISRVVQPSSNLSSFVTVSTCILESKQKSWIQSSLTEWPKQPKIKFEEFAELVLKITSVQSEKALLKEVAQFETS